MDLVFVLESVSGHCLTFADKLLQGQTVGLTNPYLRELAVIHYPDLMLVIVKLHRLVIAELQLGHQHYPLPPLYLLDLNNSLRRSKNYHLLAWNKSLVSELVSFLVDHNHLYNFLMNL